MLFNFIRNKINHFFIQSSLIATDFNILFLVPAKFLPFYCVNFFECLTTLKRILTFVHARNT